VIACLDVRANDKGDLVVTKGDQYDVRETTGDNEVHISIIFIYASLLIGVSNYIKEKSSGYTIVYECSVDLIVVG
jgi:ABC-type lipoprotein release transport system permease subunit